MALYHILLQIVLPLKNIVASHSGNMVYSCQMDTVLYFQPPTKTFAPEKLAGVRDIMERRHHQVQVIEERPTALQQP